MTMLPERLFGPTVEAVCWNTAFSSEQYLRLFIAGRVHACVGKLL